MSVIIFLIILLVLVIVHEWGHFFSAKKFGIRVDEFGFGFPPKIWGKKFGETEYSLNLLPIGGFVKIFGETPNEENMHGPDSARSMVNKPKWQQAIILFAGVFMNFLLAWALFSFGFISGLPTSLGSEPPGSVIENVNLIVVSVVKDSPAEASGLQTGDKIMYVGSGNESLSDINPNTLKSFVVSHPKEQIEIGFSRDTNQELKFVKITPALNNSGTNPTIGIAMDEVGTVKMPFFRAIFEGMKLSLIMCKNTFLGLFNLIVEALKGRGSLDSVTGPVGMVGIVGDASKFGLAYLLSFTALISINLAVINLLPLPALDGGRLLFLLIEKIKGSALNPKVANTANLIGFAALIILMLVITYHDLVKLL